MKDAKNDPTLMFKFRKDADEKPKSMLELLQNHSPEPKISSFLPDSKVYVSINGKYVPHNTKEYIKIAPHDSVNMLLPINHFNAARPMKNENSDALPNYLHMLEKHGDLAHHEHKNNGFIEPKLKYEQKINEPPQKNAPKPIIREIKPEEIAEQLKKRQKLMEGILDDSCEKQEKYIGTPIFKSAEEIKENEKLEKEIRFREKRSLTDLLSKLISNEFYTTDLPKNMPNLQKIPIKFENGIQYSNIWIPLFLEDCKYSILQPEKIQEKILQLEFEKIGTELPFIISQMIIRESDDSNTFRENDLILVSKFDKNEKLSDLLEIINKKPKFAHSENHYFIGYIRKKTRYEDKIKFEISFDQNANYYLFGFNSNIDKVKLYVRSMGCVSTQIREYQAILNAEFMQLSDYIFNPDKIHELKNRRKTKPEASEFIQKLSKNCNESQLDVLKLVGSMNEKDILLIQGPVFFIKKICFVNFQIAGYWENPCTHPISDLIIRHKNYA